MNPDEPQKPPQETALFSETAPIEETQVVLPPEPAQEPPPVAPTAQIDYFSMARPEDEVEGLPGSLMAASTQPGTLAGGSLPDPWRFVGKRAAILLGLAAGLALGIWLYLKPWTLERPFPGPEILPGPKTEAGAPRQWVWEAGSWFGRDGAGGVWIRDPEGKTLRAEGPVPDVIHPGRFSLVGRPPLEPGLTLAWIQSAEGSGATSASLRVARFDLATTGGASRTPPILQAIPLPAGSYPFAPVVLDDPDPQAGLMLVAPEAGGTLTAWRLGDGTPELAWRLGPDNPLAASRLVCAPYPAVQWSGTQPAIRLLVSSHEGLVILDGAGKPLGAPSRWLRPLAGDRRATLARVPIANGGPDWIISDGKRVERFVLDPKGGGILDARAGYNLTEDLGAAPKLLSLRHPGKSLEAHDIVAVSAEGRIAWISETAERGPKVAAGAEGVAAIDLNGDGWWDLAGLGRDGTPWVIDGRTRALCGATPDKQIPPGIRPGGSGVRWFLAPGAGENSGDVLKGVFLDEEGRMSQVQWPLAEAWDLKKEGYLLRAGF